MLHRHDAQRSSSPPGLTRRSMLTAVLKDLSVSPNEPSFRMDCRVEPGNDDNRDGTKREAERRKAHCPTNVRAADKCTQSAQLICLCGRASLFEAARRLSALTLAALATGCYPDGSAPEPGFPRLRRKVSGARRVLRRLPAAPKNQRIKTAVKHAPCGPVLVPVDRGSSGADLIFAIRQAAIS